MIYRRCKSYVKWCCRSVIIILLFSLLNYVIWFFYDDYLQENSLMIFQNSIPFTQQSDTAVKTINYYREYLFDDATLYNGSILESWPPSKNRSIERYMNYDITHQPPIHKIMNKTVLIMVQSHPNEKSYRHIWRDADIFQSKKNVALVFIIGKATNSTQETEVLNEILSYQDIVQIDELIEDYSNLTLKSLYSLKYFLSNAMFPKYMLKVDIDVFVNYRNLLQLLNKDADEIKHENLLVGNCFCCGGKSNLHCRRQAPTELERESKKNTQTESNERTKWQIPSYLYNQSNYPSYLQGPAYLMSRKSADRLFKISKEVPYFPMEDIFITGFAAQKCDIRRLHNAKFSEKYEGELNCTEHITYHADCGAIKESAKFSKQRRKACYNKIKSFTFKCTSELR